MCNEAKNIFHQGASWLCCLATHDQTGWQHHELSGWAGVITNQISISLNSTYKSWEFKMCIFRSFTIVNEDKIYLLKKWYSTMCLWATTKTCKGWNNDIFHRKILFLKEITIFKDWGSREYFSFLSWKLPFIFALYTNIIMNGKLRPSLCSWKTMNHWFFFSIRGNLFMLLSPILMLKWRLISQIS